MKIHELKIEYVRGLPEARLTPNGENLLVWGRNGSGKSGVVDAIDYLFSGSISRLEGRGSGVLSLLSHGPHVTSKASIAKVVCDLDFEDGSGIVRISRGFKSPRELDFPESSEASARLAEGYAKRGQMCLTRRDLLRFIAAEPGDRAQQVQQLLNLSRVQQTRANLVSAQNTLEERARNAAGELKDAIGDVESLIPIVEGVRRDLLEEVNAKRKALGANPIDQVSAVSFRMDVNRPQLGGSAIPNMTVTSNAIATLREFNSNPNLEIRRDAETKIRKAATRFAEDPDLELAYRHHNLLDTGFELVETHTAECPLCGTSWPPGELIAAVRVRRDNSKSAESLHQQIAAAVTSITEQAKPVVSAVDRLSAELTKAAFTDPNGKNSQILSEWKTSLSTIQEALARPQKEFINQFPTSDSFEKRCAPAGIGEILDQIDELSKTVKVDATPEEQAWDWLTRLEQPIKRLEKSKIMDQYHGSLHVRARSLLQAYEQAQREVLSDLYGKVSNRAATFYRILHPDPDSDPDTATYFEMVMSQKGPSLNVEVKFHDGKLYPPNAVHSEGQQDSLGICLFLALTEELAPFPSAVVVFDDVVMSLDSGHRRYICDLLKNEFPDRQFVITTHDRNWAKQLQYSKTVPANNVYEFTGWTLESGPMIHRPLELWDDIDEALEQERVAEAAFKLRRSGEQLYEAVCDSLGAELKYNSQMEWDFGDYHLAATARYRTLLKRAISSAKSWELDEELKRLEELDKRRSELYRRRQDEWWTVNSSVHFNKWIELEGSELKPIIDVFRELEKLFHCEYCGDLVTVEFDGNRETMMRCSCTKTANFNLVIK